MSVETGLSALLDYPVCRGGYHPPFCHKWAFKDCTALTQIRIPASVTSIDETAFDGCVLVLVYGAPGSTAQTFCATHDNCVFVPEDAGV